MSAIEAACAAACAAVAGVSGEAGASELGQTTSQQFSGCRRLASSIARALPGKSLSVARMIFLASTTADLLRDVLTLGRMGEAGT